MISALFWLLIGSCKFAYYLFQYLIYSSIYICRLFVHYLLTSYFFIICAKHLFLYNLFGNLTYLLFILTIYVLYLCRHLVSLLLIRISYLFIICLFIIQFAEVHCKGINCNSCKRELMCFSSDFLSFFL